MRQRICIWLALSSNTALLFCAASSSSASSKPLSDSPLRYEQSDCAASSESYFVDTHSEVVPREKLPRLPGKLLSSETARKSLEKVHAMFKKEAELRARATTSSLPQTKKEWRKIDLAKLALHHTAPEDTPATTGQSPKPPLLTQEQPLLTRHLSMPDVAALTRSIAPATPPRRHALRSSMRRAAITSSSSSSRAGHHTIFSAAVKGAIEKLLPQVGTITLDQEQSEHPAGRSIILHNGEHTVYIHMTVAKNNS